MQCGPLDKTRDAATAQKNPAFGGADRLFGCVAMLASKNKGYPLFLHIVLRTAPARIADLHPSNDSVWSRTALASIPIRCGTTPLGLPSRFRQTSAECTNEGRDDQASAKIFRLGI